jgi:hypothetical protein
VGIEHYRLFIFNRLYESTKLGVVVAVANLFKDEPFGTNAMSALRDKT